MDETALRELGLGALLVWAELRLLPVVRSLLAYARASAAAAKVRPEDLGREVSAAELERYRLQLERGKAA